jgi:hypothetical protein
MSRPTGGNHSIRVALLGAAVALGCSGGGGDTGSGGHGGATVSGTADGGSDSSAGAGGAAGAAGATATGGSSGPAGGSAGGGAAGSSTAGTGGGGAGGAVPPGAVKFEKNVRVNDDSGSGMHTEVVVAAGPSGLVVANWMDFRGPRTCGFAVSTDGGATWSKNFFIMVAGSQFVGDPGAAIDGDGRIYVVCQDYGLSQIRLSTSTDKGQTWSAPKSIQSSPDKPWIGASPTMSGVAVASWLGGSAGVRATQDGGMTWGPVHPLEFLNHGTTISVGSSGVVHVAFSPNGGIIRYARSKTLGDSWESTRTIVADTGNIHDCAGVRQHPVVGGGSDTTGHYAVVAWTGSIGGSSSVEDVYVTYSSDSGDTWTKPIKVNDNATGACAIQPWATVDDHGRVHVVWTDTRNGKNDTYYARSANPSQGFEKNLQVNDGGGSVSGFLGDYKGITISGKDVIVVWNDTRSGSNIYSARAPGAAGP